MHPPWEQKISGLNPTCAGIFPGSSHTSDFKIGTPAAALPSAWCYRVSGGTGQPGVSILWLGEMESWICNFYLSVAARKIVWADPWDTLACCWDVKQPTNKQALLLGYWGSLNYRLASHLNSLQKCFKSILTWQRHIMKQNYNICMTNNVYECILLQLLLFVLLVLLSKLLGRMLHSLLFFAFVWRSSN